MLRVEGVTNKLRACAGHINSIEVDSNQLRLRVILFLIGLSACKLFLLKCLLSSSPIASFTLAARGVLMLRRRMHANELIPPSLQRSFS